MFTFCGTDTNVRFFLLSFSLSPPHLVPLGGSAQVMQRVRTTGGQAEAIPRQVSAAESHQEQTPPEKKQRTTDEESEWTDGATLDLPPVGSLSCSVALRMRRSRFDGPANTHETSCPATSRQARSGSIGCGGGPGKAESFVHRGKATDGQETAIGRERSACVEKEAGMGDGPV